MTPTITQRVKFSASPATLFEMYMDSKKHSTSTGAPAKLSRKVGGTWHAHGGAIGGNAIGGAAKNVTIGPTGNTIAGAVGGVAGGSLLTSLIPMLSGGAGGVDIGALAGQLVGGGVSGAIVTAIVGVIMNNMKKS